MSGLDSGILDTWDMACCAVLSHSVVSDPIAHQAPLSMGILQARIPEWIAMPSSRGSSWPRDWTQVSCVAGRWWYINWLEHMCPWAGAECLGGGEKQYYKDHNVTGPGHLWCARHSPNCTSCINSCNPLHNPFYRWGNWGPERLRESLEVGKPVEGGDRIWLRASESPATTLDIWLSARSLPWGGRAHRR